jgi:flagellar basal body-associated protein FliL
MTDFDVTLAKEIAEETAVAVVAEEEKKKKALIIALISVGVAVAAAIAAAAVILSTKNKDGERRGKVLIMKIKNKLPGKKKKEDSCEDFVDEDCDFEIAE